MATAAAILAGLYLLFNFTRFGVLARATIQVPHMAEALGVNTRFIYSLTLASVPRSPARPAAFTRQP